MTDQRKIVAYALPMSVFVGLLAVVSFVKKAGGGFWLSAPEYWIYPLQTVLCAGLLLWFRRDYPLQRPYRIWFGIGIGLFVFLLWISPQQWFGYAARRDGFDPGVFSGPVLYWGTVLFRFARLVIVVPLVEEIFWRGFLLRYLINEDFEKVSIGTFSWLSFAVVTAAFTFSHSSADWPAAFLTGILFNGVAYRTKSLSTCVVTHALTNLLLGLWIMRTGQWGFW
jgi:CAAX prenyl protease-like protein